MDDELVPWPWALGLLAAGACAPSQSAHEPAPVTVVRQSKAPPEEEASAAPVVAEPTPVSFHAHGNLRSPDGGVMGMLFSQRCVDVAERRRLLFVGHEDTDAPRPPDAKVVVFLRDGDTCVPEWRPVVAQLGKTAGPPEAECPAWWVSGCELLATEVAAYGAWQTADSWHEIHWGELDNDGVDPINTVKVKVPGTHLEFRSHRERDDEIWLGDSIIAKISSAATYPRVDGAAFLKYERGLARLSDRGLTPVPLVSAVRQVPPPKVDERGQN